jgi:hypothetical protein
LTKFWDGKDCSLIDKEDAAFGPLHKETGDRPKLKDIPVGQRKKKDLFHVSLLRLEAQSEIQL